MNRSVLSKTAILLITLAITFVMSSVAFGQESTGSIVGTVRDAAGAVVPGATVTIADSAKGNLVVRTLITNDEGEFTAPNLPVAVYQVSVEAKNFKKSVKSGVKLDVGQRLGVNITLEAGKIEEVVNVEADPVAVDSVSATNGTLINGDQVRELSLNNRNFIQLVTLAPGVTDDLDDVVNTGTNNPDTQVVNRTLISVNGGRATQNTFTVDGADITDRGSNLTIQSYPSVDSIGEFKVLRSLYPAESGRSGGGQVNVVTRSGGKDFHGSAFEFIRNEAFNANTNNAITLNATNLNAAVAAFGRDTNGRVRRKPFRYNNYGFTVSGPVYFFNFGDSDDGKGVIKRYNQTFFFFSEEQRKDKRYPTLGPSTVPTAQMKQGIFPVNICLTATTTCTSFLPAGTPLSSMVPVSSVASQYISKIWNFVPEPSATNLQLSFPTLNLANFRQEIVKIDHSIGKNLSMYYRFGNDKIPTEDADGSIGTRSGIPFVNEMSSNSPGRTHTFQTTYVATPNLIFVGRYNYGFGAIFTETTGLISKERSPIAINLPYENTRDVVSILAVNGFNSLTGFSNYDNFSWKQNFSGDVTWINGNHTLKFGAVYSMYRKNENALGGTAQGSFGTFNNSTTSGSVLAAGVTNNTVNQLYQRWANFMQGNLVTFTQNKFDLTADFRQKAFEWFGQDEWRARRNLSLYYGVRYSFFGSPIDKNGKLTNFVPSLWNAANAPQVTGGAQRVGGNWCNGLIVNAQNFTTGPASFNCTPTASPWGEHVYDVSKADFAPRVGLSWDPFGKGKVAIRMGYGMYHEQIPVGPIEVFLGQNPPYQETCTVTNTTLANPVPAGTCTAAAPSATVPTIRGIQSDFKTPYMQHWSLDGQWQPLNKTLISLGYYGSKGTHLVGNTELNELRVGQALGSQCATGTNTLANPGVGGTVVCLAAGAGLFTGNTANTLIDQIRPYRGFRSLNMIETRYNSNYHSLQLSAQQRFSQGSQVNLSYTFAKNLTDNSTSFVTQAPQNTYDTKSEYGRAVLNRAHVLKINFVYEIPFFSKQNGFLGKVLGGWQASSIITYQTGLPLTATTSGYDPAGLGFINAQIAGGRPNILCDPNTGGAQTITQWFNTACFQANPLSTATNIVNTPGTAPRGVIDGPPATKVDFSMSKNLVFGEGDRFKVQLRAESFNVFNSTIFRGVSTNVTATTFGQITSFRDPRIMQFGAKFYF